MIWALIAPEHRDVITTGGQVLIAIVTTLGAIQVALIQQGRRENRRILDAAQAAAERSEPTGDGFARRVEAALARVEHDLGGVRSEIRATNRRLDTTAERLDRHIDRSDG